MLLDPKKLNVEADILDVLEFEDQHAAYTQPSAETAEQQPVPAVDTVGAKAIKAELFTSLYRMFPKVRSDAPCKPLAKLLEEMQQTAAYTKLHSSTFTDATLSYGGAVALYPALKEQYDQLLQKIQEAIEARERASNLEELLNGQSTPETEELLQQLQQQADMAEQSAMQQLQADAGHMKRRIKSALEQVEQNFEKAQELAGGWGSEPGQIVKFVLDPDMKKLINSRTIARIMEMAGRLKPLLVEERSKRPFHWPQDLSLTLGGELSKVLPSELARMALGEEELELLFFADLAMSRLQSREYRGQKEGRGPFIICIDESGSMTDEQLIWAKAVALALVGQANRERRDFGAIAFSSAEQQRAIWRPTPAQFLEWASQCYSGGTDFEQPLQLAMQMLEENGQQANGDIIFVTDGEAEISPEFSAKFDDMKRKTRTKVLGVFVALDRYDHTETLAKFCDQIIPLKRFANNDELISSTVNIFSQMR